MNFVLRNFFYGVGLTALWLLTRLPAETVQFGDCVLIVQSSLFWTLAGCAAAILASLDIALTGKVIIPSRPPASSGGSSRRHETYASASPATQDGGAALPVHNGPTLKRAQEERRVRREQLNSQTDDVTSE